MIKLIPLLLAVILVFYLVQWARRRQLMGGVKTPAQINRMKVPVVLKETWTQLYETSSKDEAQKLKIHLEELEIQNIVYEQGKKGVDGKPMPGLGCAVPKSQLKRAQSLLFRFLDKK